MEERERVREREREYDSMCVLTDLQEASSLVCHTNVDGDDSLL